MTMKSPFYTLRRPAALESYGIQKPQFVLLFRHFPPSSTAEQPCFSMASTMLFSPVLKQLHKIFSPPFQAPAVSGVSFAHPVEGDLYLHEVD